MRRTHLRGHPNILERLLVHVGGFNLWLLMRQLTGIGTPRSLQRRAAAIRAALTGLLVALWERVRPFWAPAVGAMHRALKSLEVPTHLYVAPREGPTWRELRHQLSKMIVESDLVRNACDRSGV